MILLAYRLLCVLMAGLAMWCFFGDTTRQQKAAIGAMLIPLVLRALLIK